MTTPDSHAEFLLRLQAATEFLEELVADRGLLAGIRAEDRRRLLDAVGQVYHPDPIQRRKLVKATVRQRKAARVEREERVLADTGIRRMRRQTVFTSPNVFPPPAFEPSDVPPDQDAGFTDVREAIEPQHCYVCKQDFTDLHHFYDQLCPACAELNFYKRTELADLRGRVALLTGGRVKIGYQAGLKLPGAGPRSSSPPASRATPPRVTRASRISRNGATASRSSGSISGTLRASRRSVTSCSNRATGSTSSSTMPARRCAVRLRSTST